MLYGYTLKQWLEAALCAVCALAFGIVYVDLLILVLGG